MTANLQRIADPTVPTGSTDASMPTPTRSRRDFAAVAYRHDWQHDKLVLPCGPAQGCDYVACAGWRSEYESLVDETQYSAAEVAEARQFRDLFLGDRVVAGQVLA